MYESNKHIIFVRWQCIRILIFKLGSVRILTLFSQWAFFIVFLTNRYTLGRGLGINLSSKTAERRLRRDIDNTKSSRSIRIAYTSRSESTAGIRCVLRAGNRRISGHDWEAGILELNFSFTRVGCECCSAKQRMNKISIK